ncbi:MAG: putative nucleotidyltransferase substrate binding domain-containing protein [Mycobacterium sp.]
MSSERATGRGIAASISGIDAADDEAALRGEIARARDAIRIELAAHTPAAALAAAWSEVLRHGVASGVRLVGGDAETRWTWLVSGSVARGEAAPGSDVETMIALSDAVAEPEKGALMARAAEVHDLLERCGVPGDANGVLASRPRFCRRWNSWSDGIERWSVDPRADRGVVMTGLLADSTGARNQSGGARLRAQAVAAVGRSYPARQGLLQDATAVRAHVPSRLRLFTTHGDSVDLKLAAIDPVVKIARWAALSAGSDALPTHERLNVAVAAKVLDQDDGSSLRDCFDWLLRFRWRTRAAAWLRGERVSDVVSLSETAPQERAMLRSVAREVAGISRKLTYLASTSSFD